MNFISLHWQEILLIITGTISVASVIVKLTPSPADDKILAKIHGIISMLALNKDKK